MNTATQSSPQAASLSMTPEERRSVAALAGIYATRMLGLFLLLPVLALYARQLPGSSPTLIGLAMGMYGLAQAVFQIPFGRWSDRHGRRPVIALGLGLFLLGSVIGALSHSLWMIILARAVQGAGAMSAAVTALLSDVTRDVIRTRAMALIGISIGASFVVSLIAAPILDEHIGVPGIFWVMALLAVLGLWWLARVPQIEQRPDTVVRIPTWRVAGMATLRSYFVGVFALHFILQATFLSVPLLLQERLGIPKAMHWEIYLGVFCASLLGTLPLIRASEKVARPQRVVTLAVLAAAVGQMAMALGYGHYWLLLCAFALFFAAFNFLEARLPAGLSKIAPVADLGAALGVFATCQFLGSAAGGLGGGQLLKFFGITGVLWGCAVMALIWAVVSARQVE
jgi:predicted MFS family arabinose efflux permease